MIRLRNYTFEGPYTSTAYLQNRSGVYAILDDRNHVLDIGESAEIKNRIESHDRQDCWRRNGIGTLKVAVYYTYESHRMLMEQELREFFAPVCGIR